MTSMTTQSYGARSVASVKMGNPSLVFGRWLLCPFRERSRQKSRRRRMRTGGSSRTGMDLLKARRDLLSLGTEKFRGPCACSGFI